MSFALPSVHGEPSWSLECDRVRLHVTARGGHIAPVEFLLPDKRRFAPYSLAPWTPAAHPDAPPILQILRGDFFCFPFGADDTFPSIHGAPANAPWSRVSAEAGRLDLALDLDRPAGGRVEKTLTLRAGHSALYQEHRISGVSGNFNYGHHPVLHIPEGETAELRTSPLRFAGVYDYPPSEERHALAAGARFTSLDDAPLAAGGVTSLKRYPTRPGHEDIVMLTPATTVSGLAWTALTFSRCLWVSLRNVADFPSTLLWMSDGGRDALPWNGCHTRRIGVEDVCSHFCDGALVSREDRLRAEGVRTSREFRADNPVSLRHIQFVAPVPPDFGGLADVEYHADAQAVTLHGENGARILTPLDWNFLT